MQKVIRNLCGKNKSYLVTWAINVTRKDINS